MYPGRPSVRSACWYTCLVNGKAQQCACKGTRQQRQCPACNSPPQLRHAWLSFGAMLRCTLAQVLLKS
jgi:hypothetical protein